MRGRDWLRLLRPDAFADSVYDVDLDELKKDGFQFLFLDIDNTLVEWNGRHIPESLRQWVLLVKSAGFRVCIVSNNKHHRVAEFSRDLELPFVAMAGKPRMNAFRKALKTINAPAEESVVIGDQIFTDILGGNRNGLYTVLVVPVGEKELWATRQVRRVERWVLRKLEREGAVDRVRKHAEDN